ncbi:MAG: hypothetical protein P8Y44_11960, partial [Acidobacteriota bacterium]
MKSRLNLFVLLTSIGLPLSAQPTSPADFVGHPIGADRQLVPYSKVLEYLRSIAAESERVSIDEAGRSTLGNDMVAVVLTSEA